MIGTFVMKEPITKTFFTNVYHIYKRITYVIAQLTAQIKNTRFT